ncbi:hypothetical protein DEU42_102315 [Flavobacterium sp. AG291]|nr:hypothetical protein DEU42_102315 [Flavobacterium sp. AG291]
MYLLKLLSYVGHCILLINTIVYSIGFSQKGKAYKAFVVYLFCLFVMQTVTEVYATQNLNNHFIATYYLFLPLILLSLFFFRLFAAINSWKRHVVLYASPIATIGFIIQYCFLPNLYYEFNSIGLLVATCLLIVYAVMYLFELISKQLEFHYVVIGIFIYSISSLLIFVSAASVVSFNQEMSNFIWNINALLFIVYQLLILWEWKQTYYLRPTRRD